MGSVERTIRCWCDRLDAAFQLGASEPTQLGIAGSALSKSDDSAAVSKANERLVHASQAARFSVELKDKETELVLSNACSFTLLVSSRWGHDPQRHRKLGQYLMRSASEARIQQTVLLVAVGSAVEPWARRASKLTGASMLRIGFEERAGRSRPQILVRCSGHVMMTRDQGAITMADRIDALYVRRGGHIEHCLIKRLEQPTHHQLRVGITSLPNCAGFQLMQAGAIGWFVPEQTEPADPVRKSVHVGSSGERVAVKQSSGQEPQAGLFAARAWLEEMDGWLVHCTRASNGPWPDETRAQYQDTILTGDSQHANRTALDALSRIIQSRQLLASAIVSSREYPVVCFSAVPLLRLLQQRCFRAHVHRWDYEPYGIAVRLEVVRRLGGLPVIYGQPEDREKLSSGQRFRYQALGKSVDWRKEKEWRIAGNLPLRTLQEDDVRVFALDSPLARESLIDIPWGLTLLERETRRLSKKTQNGGLSEIWKAV